MRKFVGPSAILDLTKMRDEATLPLHEHSAPPVCFMFLAGEPGLPVIVFLHGVSEPDATVSVGFLPLTSGFQPHAGALFLVPFILAGIAACQRRPLRLFLFLFLIRIKVEYVGRL